MPGWQGSVISTTCAATYAAAGFERQQRGNPAADAILKEMPHSWLESKLAAELLRQAGFPSLRLKMTQTASDRSRRLNLPQLAVVWRWESLQRPEVLVETDYDIALDLMAKHYSVGRVHRQRAERKVNA